MKMSTTRHNALLWMVLARSAIQCGQVGGGGSCTVMLLAVHGIELGRTAAASGCVAGCSDLLLG